MRPGRWGLWLCGVAALAPAALADDGRPVRLGSKVFTESVVLAELGTQAVSAAGVASLHRRELGGTRVLWNALLAGEIDAYPEYTGTIREEILGKSVPAGDQAMAAALAAAGVRMSAALGFSNTYAVGMRSDVAARLGIGRISDLGRHPALRFGFSNELMDRADGWPGLRQAYRLPQGDVRGLAHDLAYRALAAGEIDATDLYSTDAEIRAYGLTVLADDRGYFPDYRAVWLTRADLASRAPAALAALESLAGTIDEAAMIAMNARARLDRVAETEVASAFLAGLGRGPAGPPVASDSRWRRIANRTGEHLALVGVALAAAIVVAIPLGIVAFKRRRLGALVLAATGILQTIPSLALLVMMIPWLGIGERPAMAALFLYGLLPIVRNTVSGLADVPLALRESALALGLSSRAGLWLVELPLATRSILAGIKTSAVIAVGTATLGALVGAGGYGQPILTGIRLADTALILEGAVPAALLALLVQGGFDLVERFLLPPPLRTRASLT